MIDNETIEVMLMSLLYLSFKCMTHFSLPFIYPFFSIFLAGFSFKKNYDFNEWDVVYLLLMNNIIV